MFEYLMPLLIMPTYANTYWIEPIEQLFQRQIEYGRKRGVPWEIRSRDITP